MCSEGWHISLKNIGKIMVSIKQKSQKGNAKIAVHGHKNPVYDKTAAPTSKSLYDSSGRTGTMNICNHDLFGYDGHGLAVAEHHRI